MIQLFLYEYSVVQPEHHSILPSVRREGRAIFQALMEDALQLSRQCNVVTLPVLTGHQDEEIIFRQAARSCDYALIVAPEFDRILEQRCLWVLKSGCRLLGPGLKAIRICSDKWALYQHWRQHQVPTPGTWLASMPVTSKGPFIQKHRYGAGSLGAMRVDDLSQVDPNAIIQEFISGITVSQSLLISRSSVCQLLPGRQEINQETAFSYLGGCLPLEDRYLSRLARLISLSIEGIPDLLGYIGVDAILGEAEDGSQDVVLEINPRMTTSFLGLRKITKTNLIGQMLQCVQGESPTKIQWTAGHVRFTATGQVYFG